MCHDLDSVVHIRCVDLNIGVEFGFEVSAEFVHACFLFTFNTTGFGAINVFVAHALCCQFGQLCGANAITAHELGVDTQLLHLLEHRTCHSVHATKEDDIGLFAFEGGQDGVEIGSFVSREFVTDQITTSSLDCFFKLFSHTLAVGSAVINHGNVFAFEGFNSVLTQGATQVHVVSHHTESAGIALACVFGVGR